MVLDEPLISLPPLGALGVDAKDDWMAYSCGFWVRRTRPPEMMDCGGKRLNVDHLALGAAGVPGAQITNACPRGRR